MLKLSSCCERGYYGSFEALFQFKRVNSSERILNFDAFGLDLTLIGVDLAVQREVFELIHI